VADITRQLARWRVPLGFLFSVAVIALAHPTGFILLLGGAVAATGEALRVWAAGHLNKSREVTSSGPYQWFAHPLYVGSSIMGAGLATASGSVAVAILIVVYLLTTISAAIRNEEQHLTDKFGAEYVRYRRTRDSSRRSRASARQFSVAQAIAN
jgi:protein-S-isoprenylcysteine O-methyltransferase Ste14